MNGLCHKCFRSNIEVFLVSGETLCKDCMNEKMLNQHRYFIDYENWNNSTLHN